MTPPSPKIVLSTVCDDAFEPGYITMLESLLQHNPWFDHEIRVICSREAFVLSDETRARMRERYSYTTFHDVDLTRYEPLLGQGRHLERLVPAYVKLEAFGFVDADRVVVLDTDLIILGDVSELFECADPFNAVEANNFDSGARGFANTAVFVINGENLTGDRYLSILATTIDPDSPTAHTADQAVIFEHFGGLQHRSLDPRFNVLRARFPDTMGDLRSQLRDFDARIFHVGGAKPWFAGRSASKYLQSDQVWLEAYLSAVSADDLARMLVVRRERQDVSSLS